MNFEGDMPEYLSGHTANLYKNFMYVYGGRLTASKSSNILYRFDLINLICQAVELDI